MTAKIISGTEIAAQIRQELSRDVAELKEKGIVPGLVTILAGDNPASVSYVTAKQKTAHELGFHSVQDSQPSAISQAELLTLIERYNRDPAIHGILVQLPLPAHIDESAVLNAIDPDKDVDGFHPVNVGRLMIGGDQVKFPPCTPAGIQELIVRSGFRDQRGRGGGCGPLQYCGQAYRQHAAAKSARRERNRYCRAHAH